MVSDATAGPSERFASGLRTPQPGDDALPNPRALELGERTKHVRDELTARRAVVEALPQRDEPDAPVLEVPQQLNQVLQRSPEPVE
jgi:hypothetical protein